MVENFENLKIEIIDDLKIDQLNILDKQLMLPTLKHKWVTRLIRAKQKLLEFDRMKKEIKKSAMLEIGSQKIPKVAVDAKLENSEKFREINSKMEDLEILVEYLEKVEKIFSEMNFGIKNSVELMKMEIS